MKNRFFVLYLLLSLFFINCKAQTIVNINTINQGNNSNKYFKDVNNLLNPFEGTWVHTNGSASLKIVLVKKAQQYNGRYYEDLIIGEYEYKVNGVVIISTLSNINATYSNQSCMHNVGGNSIISKTNRPICIDCTVNEKRLRLGFQDPLQDSYGTMIVKKTTVGVQEAIKVRIKRTGFGHVWIDGIPPPPDFTVPSGEYILIKQ